MRRDLRDAPELPTTARQIQSDINQWRYHDPESLKPEAAYGGWDPADHFLSFKTITLDAQVCGTTLRSRGDQSWRSFAEPAWKFDRDMEDVRRDMARHLAETKHVADQAGVEVSVEYTIRVRVKAWPDVPGVTT